MEWETSRIVGGNTLQGEVSISGSKNTCLALLMATLLTKETCVLRNVPRLNDVFNMIELMRHLGVNIYPIDNHAWSITSKEINHNADLALAKRLRASVYLLGAMLGREHHASIPFPGGCQFGHRPIDLHLKAFEALGATVTQDQNIVHLCAQSLCGATFSMKGTYGPTLTGTNNAILAAVLASGQSIIRDASQEPEVIGLCTFLRQMGASIEGIGTTQLIIDGVPSLHGVDFTILPDRIEAGTFLILGLLCCPTLRIINAPREVLCGFSEILPYIHDYCHWDGHDLIVHALQDETPFNLYTRPYPGFPTDLQPQITVLASQIQGESRIHDTIFPERFVHMDAFQKLGMNIRNEGMGTIVIQGKTSLHGAEIAATDLRAGAAMYLAALIADGTTMLSKIDYVHRGYECFEDKLRTLGASIEGYS